jgi:uncharacterized protein (TIGR02421 family)
MKSWPKYEAGFERLQQILAPDDWVLPANLQDEKSRFFAALAEGGAYDPVFVYVQVSPKAEMPAVLHADLPSEPVAMSDWYTIQHERLADQARHFTNRATTDFPVWLTAQYGAPDTELLSAANDILRKPVPQASPESLDAAAVQKAMRGGLDELGLDDWTVDIAAIAAKVEVQSLFRRIRIQEGARFSPEESARLKEHEIGVHCLRYANGARQPYRLFRHGLPDYLESEEGLAAYAEERTGTLSGRDMRRYALRVIACDLAQRLGFASVFHALRNLGCPPEEAFSLTARVKRGLTDTSLPGGWTKDQIYLRGWLKVRRASPEDIRALFQGKIGLQHIARCRTLGLETGASMPEWVENCT